MKALFALTISIILTALLWMSATSDPVRQYVIGPDDVLDIQIANHEELNKVVTVLEDGTITLSEVGTISVEGKTPRDVAAVIKTALSRTRKMVEVYISPKEIHSRNVRVLGAIKMPGAYEIKPEWHVMDLVDSAGGLTQKPARILGRIVRNRSQMIPVDIQKADSKRDSDANVPLMRDDLLILDEAELSHPQVFVLGCVNKPGVFDLEDQTSVLSVLTMAGGPTDKAALSMAYVTRNGQKLPINLTNTALGVVDPAVASFKFQPGDVLYIPENQIHIMVQGSVARPGPIPLPESGDVTVLDAFNLAGGSTGGNLSKAGVIRTVDGKAKEIPVNIEKMLKKGEMADNIVLKPNDMLYIPANNNRTFQWSNLLLPLTAASLLGMHF